MPFPSSFIAELKARNPIDNVISRYVELKRAGSNLVGVCPFHSERSPSFTVFEDHFHCFGCSAGGDVITFIMRMENLEYRDAIQFLADRCGLTVPEDSYVPKRPASALTREKAFEMNKLAARHFYENLMSPEGAQARKYLDDRKLERTTRTRFGLGFAKNSFNDLIDFLTSKGFTVEEIKENFLCGISQKSGKPFDMFRNRVMFPIIDTSGNIIAFGGRVMDDSKPKYLNSSDTVIFKKSRNLFALNFAKNAVLGDKAAESDNSALPVSYVKSGELIICEGYMDVISMHQAGFSNAVATLGTAITSEHARMIARYAKTVYLAYDSDSAGQNATSKAIQMLTDVGVDAKVLKIDGAKDPDEYIKKYGAASFAKILDASEGQTDYKLNKILNKYDLSIPDDKIKAVREACKMLAEMHSLIKQEIYSARLSELTGIKLETINAEINYSKRSEARRVKAKFNDDIQKKLLGYDDKINMQAASNHKAVSVEQRILGILMLYPEMLDEVEISSEDFITDFNKTLFVRLKEIYDSGEFDLSALNEFYSPQEYAYILEMKNSREKLSANGKNTLKEQIDFLKSLKTNNQNDDSASFAEMMEKIRNDKMKGC